MSFSSALGGVSLLTSVFSRHRNAIVVRDPSSQRLEIRGLSECPTCRQPLRSSSPDRQFDSARHHDSFVDPNYFRMLRAGHHSVRAEHPPSSPIRRFVQPILATPQPAVFEDTQDVEFISSTPAVQEGSRIRREAFSPNYFKTFFVEEKELGRGGKGVVLLVRHEIDGCHLGTMCCSRRIKHDSLTALRPLRMQACASRRRPCLARKGAHRG